MIVTRLQEGLLYHGNDRLINLAVGAVAVIVFLLIGRLKRLVRKPPSDLP